MECSIKIEDGFFEKNLNQHEKAIIDLYCAILLCVLEDGMLYKNPRSISDIVLSEENLYRKNLENFLKIFLFFQKIESINQSLKFFMMKNSIYMFCILKDMEDYFHFYFATNSFRNNPNLRFYLKYLRFVLNKKVQEFENEIKSYHARNFITMHNDQFLLYCKYSGIDPEIFIEKTKNIFNDFDNGNIKSNKISIEGINYENRTRCTKNDTIPSKIIVEEHDHRTKNKFQQNVRKTIKRRTRINKSECRQKRKNTKYGSRTKRKVKNIRKTILRTISHKKMNSINRRELITR
jgi:hypothetical protein